MHVLDNPVTVKKSNCKILVFSYIVLSLGMSEIVGRLCFFSKREINWDNIGSPCESCKILNVAF